MKVVVCADSVQGGAEYDAPGVRRALELLGVQADVVVYAGPYCTIADTREVLPEIIGLAPDLVVVAHGGAEGLLRPATRGADGGPVLVGRPLPLRASDSPAPPDRGRAVAAVRHTLRSLPLVHRLRRLANGPKLPVMPWQEFEQHYSHVVHALVTRSAARVVLLRTVGADPRYVLTEPGRRRKVSALVDGCRRDFPDRVVVVDPSAALHRWDDFARDRAHLRTSGFEKVARVLADELAATGCPSRHVRWNGETDH
jgi:hypothetical protein